MAKGDMWGKIGSWAFLIGVIIALIVGLYAAYNLETNGETFVLLSQNSNITLSLSPINS